MRGFDKGIGMTRRLGWLAAAAAALVLAGAANGQQTAPLPPAIPAPQDIPYPAGPIAIGSTAYRAPQLGQVTCMIKWANPPPGVLAAGH